MREILEVKELQIKERGCVPNLQGASPVGCDDGNRPYAARTDGRGRPGRRRRGH